MICFKTYCVPNYDASIFGLKPLEEKNYKTQNQNQNPNSSIKKIKNDINKEKNINFGVKENQEPSHFATENTDDVLKLVRRKLQTKHLDENKKIKLENENANSTNNFNNLEIVSKKSLNFNPKFHKIPEKLLLEEKILEEEEKEIDIDIEIENNKEIEKDAKKEAEKEEININYFISLPNKDENFQANLLMS
jgi:hypothetical protein